MGRFTKHLWGVFMRRGDKYDLIYSTKVPNWRFELVKWDKRKKHKNCSGLMYMYFKVLYCGAAKTLISKLKACQVSNASPYESYSTLSDLRRHSVSAAANNQCRLLPQEHIPLSSGTIRAEEEPVIRSYACAALSSTSCTSENVENKNQTLLTCCSVLISLSKVMSAVLKAMLLSRPAPDEA